MQAAVLEWYADNARDLAFRRSKDPWSVLLSEVIAQQTQARRAAAGWERLIGEFPSPAAMAAATPAAVIRSWRGLGYNRRAVALHRAATAMVERHGGRVPDTLAELRALPGIGPSPRSTSISAASSRAPSSATRRARTRGNSRSSPTDSCRRARRRRGRTR
jgi:A/G-specific adenine glycosylase